MARSSDSAWLEASLTLRDKRIRLWLRTRRDSRSRERVTSLRSSHRIPVHRPADGGREPWLNLTRAASMLGVAPTRNLAGKPWENGTEESFNGKFRDECLSLEWFRTRREAIPVIELWRQHYNQVRPHSSLGYKPPAPAALADVSLERYSRVAIDRNRKLLANGLSHRRSSRSWHLFYAGRPTPWLVDAMGIVSAMRRPETASHGRVRLRRSQR